MNFCSIVLAIFLLFAGNAKTGLVYASLARGETIVPAHQNNSKGASRAIINRKLWNNTSSSPDEINHIQDFVSHQPEKASLSGVKCLLKQKDNMMRKKPAAMTVDCALQQNFGISQSVSHKDYVLYTTSLVIPELTKTYTSSVEALRVN